MSISMKYLCVCVCVEKRVYLSVFYFSQEDGNGLFEDNTKDNNTTLDNLINQFLAIL